MSEVFIKDNRHAGSELLRRGLDARGDATLSAHLVVMQFEADFAVIIAVSPLNMLVCPILRNVPCSRVAKVNGFERTLAADVGTRAIDKTASRMPAFSTCSQTWIDFSPLAAHVAL